MRGNEWNAGGWTTQVGDRREDRQSVKEPRLTFSACWREEAIRRECPARKEKREREREWD